MIFEDSVHIASVILIIVGLFLMIARLHRNFLRISMLNDITNDLERKFKEIFIPVVVEQHDNKFFLYHLDTSQYISSGDTVQELIKNVRDRYPDRLVSIEGGDAELIEVVLSQVLSYEKGVIHD